MNKALHGIYDLELTPPKVNVSPGPRRRREPTAFVSDDEGRS